MRTIWKFPLSLEAKGWQRVEAGPGPVVLCELNPDRGSDHGPCVWIEHDPDQVGKGPVREFGIFPTGGTIAADADYRGSIIDGSFVWHIYERRP